MSLHENTFTRSERLRGNKTISSLFAGGKSGFVYPFRYIYLTREMADIKEREGNGDTATPAEVGGDESLLSVLVSVSKRYHKRANKRNLIKRRTREAFRTGKNIFYANNNTRGKMVSFALIYITKDILEYKTIENAVRKILAEIAKSC